MVLQFLSLILLCATSPTQTSDSNVTDINIVGCQTFMPTAYIEAYFENNPNKPILIHREQYGALQKNSLQCIEKRLGITIIKEKADLASMDVSITEPYYNAMYFRLTDLHTICSRTYTPGTQKCGFFRVSEKYILYHLQWIRALYATPSPEPFIDNNYSIHIQLDDGSIFEATSSFKKAIIKHLINFQVLPPSTLPHITQ